MINILPVNDTQQHIEDSSCSCNPTVQVVNGEEVIIHNSYDDRDPLDADVERMRFLEEHFLRTVFLN